MKDLEKRIECNGLMNYFDSNKKYCLYALSNYVNCDYLVDDKTKACNYKKDYMLPTIILHHKKY